MACMVSPISGAYGVAWNSLSMGKDESGFRLISRNHQSPVRSDYYGDSLLDLIYRGQDVSAMFTSIEYGDSPLSAGWPFAASWGLMGTIGKTACGSGTAKAFVATAVSGTPAASAPASITAAKAIIAEGHSLELLFANQIRTIPLAWNFLPYTVDDVPVWFEPA